MTGTVADDPADVDDADRLDPFVLVADETRARIVETLGDARVQRGSRPVLSFSELRSRADLDIPSSQFNYHLQRLRGRFVEKVEGGYRMRVEGRIVYQALRAGTFDLTGRRSRHALDVECHYCDGVVEAAFDDGVATVTCRDCDHCYDVMGVPPAIGGGEAAVERFAAYSRQKHRSFATDCCPTCGGVLSTELRTPPRIPFDEDGRRRLSVYRLCEHCGDQLYLSLGELLVFRPEVVSFCHERGLDVLSTPLWALPFAATDESVTVRSTDPWRVSLAVQMGTEELELVLDDALDVVERSRRGLPD